MRWRRLTTFCTGWSPSLWRRGCAKESLLSTPARSGSGKVKKYCIYHSNRKHRNHTTTYSSPLMKGFNQKWRFEGLGAQTTATTASFYTHLQILAPTSNSSCCFFATIKQKNQWFSNYASCTIAGTWTPVVWPMIWEISTKNQTYWNLLKFWCCGPNYEQFWTSFH